MNNANIDRQINELGQKVFDKTIEKQNLESMTEVGYNNKNQQELALEVIAELEKEIEELNNEIEELVKLKRSRENPIPPRPTKNKPSNDPTNLSGGRRKRRTMRKTRKLRKLRKLRKQKKTQKH
jgi:hypothetical protein